MATLAPALLTLRNQIDAKFPGRNKASDGWIGNAAHASRGGADVSQHNPNEVNVVTAIDVTEDHSVGLDCNRLMEELDAANDPRMFYEIHDRAIDNSDDSRTPYYGSNPHVTHLHISSWPHRPGLYNDARPWNLPMLGGTAVIGTPAGSGDGITWEKTRYTGAAGSRVIQLGSVGDDVAFAQRFIGSVTADGEFGRATESRVKWYQGIRGLGVDGIIGAQTWGAMGVGPAPSRPRLPGPPPWDIPRGQYLGDIKGRAASRGGGTELERDNVLWWQRMLIASGCVPGQTDFMSHWADAKWEGATTSATRTWFSRFRPGQQFTDRCYSDDWQAAIRLVQQRGL